MYSLLFLAILMAILTYTQAIGPIPKNCKNKCTSTTTTQKPCMDRDFAQLDVCKKLIPSRLPLTSKQMKNYCASHNDVMICLDVNKKCLNTDSKKKTEKDLTFMHIICTESTVFRTVYLREPRCWARASQDWVQCVEKLQNASYGIDKCSELIHFNKNEQLCCARDDFVNCAKGAGRTCSLVAQEQLQQIALLHAQGEVACTHSYPHCSAAPARAPPSHAAVSILAAVTALLLYPAWL